MTSEFKVLDMVTCIAQARHSGYFGAWSGQSNPFIKGSRLWAEWNLGRRSAATGVSETELLAAQEAKRAAQGNAGKFQPMPITEWDYD
jgi:hypothetical protein